MVRRRKLQRQPDESWGEFIARVKADDRRKKQIRVTPEPGETPESVEARVVQLLKGLAK
jgi:hypothetical protein